jgi:four helix bundle protein
MERSFKTFSFEKLLVWQKSRMLAKEIYKISSKFPKEEVFGITSQMRRCCISISSNLIKRKK